MKTKGVRYLTAEIQRFLAEESKMAFVAGPRQVGKTTMAKYLLEHTKAEELHFNWDIESHRRAIIRNPEDFWLRASEHPNSGSKRLVLDEIHKFPRWKRFLKGLYDAHKGKIEIIVTGSGRLDIYQKGGDSLAGRYHRYHLYPFTLGEMTTADRNTVVEPERFWKMLVNSDVPKAAEESLHDLETLTGFPEPLFSGSESRLRRWRQTYQSSVLREDLRDLTRIREIGLLETLVTLLPERVGSPLSLNSLREDLGINFLTVQSWLQSLERLYYIFKIRPYAGKLARTLRREEKLYLFDYSVIEDQGARFENVVALHLRKLCDVWTEWGYGDFNLCYVRDREKREVDFLITKAGKPYSLVEAKTSASDPDASLRYFSERLKPQYTVQLVRAPKNFKRTFETEGIIMAPAAEFLALI